MSHKHSIMQQHFQWYFSLHLAFSNPTMTLPIWYIFTSKDFKSQITLQFLINSFVPSSKTSLDKSSWSLQVKVDNLSFTMPILSATETIHGHPRNEVLFALPHQCLCTWLQNPWMFFGFPFSGQSEWSEAFIIFKNISLTSRTAACVGEG